ncbi:MAG: MarR family transcriptional regulator [Chloroflexi bacterium]|nr:MarR family transcriptional regulator [Chloroflexota bacterium]
MSDGEDVLEVLKALVVLRRVLRTGASGNTEPKLPVAQVQVLLHLAQSGPMTMGTLARQLGVSCPAATDLVARLETAGRVERVMSTQDRRKVLVQLTPQARQIAEGALAERREKVASVLRQLPSPERAGFVRGIQMLAHALGADTGTSLAHAPPGTPETALAGPPPQGRAHRR